MNSGMKSRFKSIFWQYFKPGSTMDQIVRKFYHYFPSLSFHTKRSIRQSMKEYPTWLVSHEAYLQSFPVPEHASHRVTFILSFSNANFSALQTTLNSLLAQSYSDWELIIAMEDHIPMPARLVHFLEQDPRVRTFVTPRAGLQDLLDVSSGDYCLLCLPGDHFSSSFLSIVMSNLITSPEVDVFSFDCDRQTNSRSDPLPLFKPGRISPELLLSINYLSRSVFKTNLATTYLQDSRCDHHLMVQEWGLFIWWSRLERKLVHLPFLIMHQVEVPEIDQINLSDALSNYFNPLGIDRITLTRHHQSVRIRWDFPHPLVSIIIPTRNNLTLLRALLDSLFRLTDYPSYEVVLVDNQSDDPATLRYYQLLKATRAVKIIRYDECFNYSQAVNLGAQYAEGELLLFMNNDMEIIHPDWLTELSQWALVPEIGIVGPKLLFTSRTIQHAGVIFGIQGIAGHLYLNAPDHYDGLLGSVDWYRNVSAVTGACQMMRKSVFSKLGGYSEEYQLIFSDVDICQQAIQEGFRVLYNPNAVIVHHQSRSRGYHNPEIDILLAESRFQSLLEKGDPYYSPNLSRSTIPCLKF